MSRVEVAVPQPEGDPRISVPPSGGPRVRPVHRFALVMWVGRSMRARWMYFTTQAAAEAAAPHDIPFTVVDLERKPTETVFPTVDDIVARTRHPAAVVYRCDRRGPE